MKEPQLPTISISASPIPAAPGGEVNQARPDMPLPPPGSDTNSSTPTAVPFRPATIELPPLNTAKELKERKDNEKKGLPLVVVIIIYVVILALIGSGFYYLWQKQVAQLASLQKINNEKETQIQTLNQEITQIQTQVLETKQGPVYVDAGGRFSFYQDVSGATITVSDDQAIVTYGTVNGQVPVNGFVMTVENRLTSGLGLEQIVDRAYDQITSGQQSLDKRTEIISDNVGWSFVKVSSGTEEVSYFLQKNVQSTNYVLVTYQIKADNDAQYAQFENIVFTILKSIKIY